MEIRRDYLIELERRGSSTIGKSLESIVTGRLKIEFTTNDREGRYSFRRLIDTDGKSVEIGALFFTFEVHATELVTRVNRCDTTRSRDRHH